MTRFKIVVEYDGTGYHGWQLQKDLPTVQGEIERALERILRRATRVHGAGRTDAGVHAVGQTAHFDAEWKHPPEALQAGCNSLLPAEITLLLIEAVPDSFHARHSAVLKTYVYRIFNSKVRSSLNRLYAWHLPHHLDAPAMSEAAHHLLGSHDFAAFGAPTDGTPSTVREMTAATWVQCSDPGLLEFSITGSGFLRYMVRSLVGTLVQVGMGRITPSDFLDILKSCQRSRSGPTAPANGLCLQSVEYDHV